MAARRWAFCSALPASRDWPVVSSSSATLQVGQRLAKPGFPGLSSNSSPQTAQILIGNGIAIFYACESTLAAT